MKKAPETIWAALGDQEYPSEGGEFLLNIGDWVDDITPTEYRRADLAPTVKSLEWVKTGEDKIRVVDYYYVIFKSYDQRFRAIHHGKDLGRFNTIDEAKAEAQAHFEAIVLECIE